jgi:hypothetical protein
MNYIVLNLMSAVLVARFILFAIGPLPRKLFVAQFFSLWPHCVRRCALCVHKQGCFICNFFLERMANPILCF